MNKIKYPGVINKEDFMKNKTVDKVLYGLTIRDVTFCKRCVISNQRPNSAVEYNHTQENKKTNN